MHGKIYFLQQTENLGKAQDPLLSMADWPCKSSTFDADKWYFVSQGNRFSNPTRARRVSRHRSFAILFAKQLLSLRTKSCNSDKKSPEEGVIKEIFAIWCFFYYFKIWPPSYQKQFYWRALWYTKCYPIFHRVVRLKPADSLSKWIYSPEIWDVIYFMASAGDVMAGTVLTNDPRCSRCQPEIGGAARKTTRDARYDSRGKLSQRRGTGGWNVSLLQFRHLLFSITIPFMWRIWRPNITRLGPQFQLVNQWWLIDYSELNLQSVR